MKTTPYILTITASNFYPDSKNLEQSFINQFKKEQRIVFTEDIEEDEKHVSGIVEEIIFVPKTYDLKNYIKEWLYLHNWSQQECFSVYNAYNNKKNAILTESDLWTKK